MIAMLTGQLISKGTDQIIVEVAGGVGYRVLIPLSTFYALPDEGAIKLHIHTHVREEAIHLYGFLTLDEKSLFILLLSVSGVGPKLALNILSHANPKDLGHAISAGDINKLSSLPGIGKKSAERLVLELKEKIRKFDFTANHPHSERQQTTDTPYNLEEDALSALINLGYKEIQARNALATLTITPETPLEEILKSALKSLMR